MRLKHTENPLLFVKKALAASRPNVPRMTTAQSNLITTNYAKYEKARAAVQKASKIHRHTWRGTNTALNNLAKPEVNAVLKRYGLPFSMVQARNNLYGRKGLTAEKIAELEYRVRRGRSNQRMYNEVPASMSLAYAAGVLPARPPKGLKGYAGKRVRRNYRHRLARAMY
jgi:hypothetical protein